MIQVGNTDSPLTGDVFLEALYTLEAANAPKPYVAVLHPIQVHDLRRDIIAGGGVFGETVRRSGYVGELFGVGLYQTTSVLMGPDSGKMRSIIGDECVEIVSRGR